MKNKMVADVLTNSGKGVHPRILLREDDFERIRTSTDPVYVHGREYTIKRADEYLNTPLLFYHIPDGIRLLRVSRDTLDRSLCLGMAYRLTGEKKYAERLWLELENAASYPDWNPYHHLDVGEMLNAFGIGFDWIYDYLDSEQKRVLINAIYKNGFDATMDDYLDRERRRSYRWYQDNPGDNWVFVCNGGLTVAALAICDEDEIDVGYLEDAVGYAFERTCRAVHDMYLPDGSYSEGFTYWNYASDYLGYYVTALKSAAGTDYGLSDYEPVHISAYYVKMMCSNSFRSFNYGDAHEGFMCPEVMFFIGGNYADDRIMTFRKEEIEKNPSIARVRDLIWYKPCASRSLEGMPLGFGSVGGDNAAVRAGFDYGDLYAAIHFGENDAYHGHADTGTFVIEARGKRFICDLGADNYNVKGNYHLTYRYRAEGHNTIVINPSKEDDQNIHANTKIREFSDGTAGEPYAIADMTDVYFGKRVVRGIRMTEVDGRSLVTVRDEIELEKCDTGMWFAHTTGEIKIAEDAKSAVITMGEDSLSVNVLTGQTLEVMPCTLMYEGHNQEGQLNNSAFKKLCIRFDSDNSRIEVAFGVVEDGACALPEAKPFSQW